MDAFNAGCHVICEKTDGDGTRKRRLKCSGRARSAGLAGAMAFTWRYPGRFQRMRKMIADGKYRARP